jgi:hypothetical protein
MKRLIQLTALRQVDFPRFVPMLQCEQRRMIDSIALPRISLFLHSAAAPGDLDLRFYGFF